MSNYSLRPLNIHSEREMNTVIIFSQMTLWESRPELRINPSRVPDFGFENMEQMYRAGVANPNQRYLLVLDEDANIVGHSIIALRTNKDGERFGYFWSRYVLPTHRRQGIGSRFLAESLSWFEEQQVKRAEVHVHLSNVVLRRFYESNGFSLIDRRTDRWEYMVMSKAL
jgi:ribosomal protein S18 acetylase RimI-like enzyme